MSIEHLTFAQKLQAAEDTKTSKKRLSELAHCDNSLVRFYVADNPGTPDSTLREMIKDNYWSVRRALARSRTLPGVYLIMLLEYEGTLAQPEAVVLKCLYNNPNLPTFAKMVMESKYEKWIDVVHVH